MIPKSFLAAVLLFGGAVLNAPALFAQKPSEGEASAVIRTDAAFFDGLKARARGDNENAEKLFMEVARAQPENAAAWYELSRLAFRQNQPERAASYIQKALAIDKSNKWYREQQASVMVQSNDLAGAARVYADLGRTEKYNQDYLQKAVQLYQRLGNYKEALAQLALLEKGAGADSDEVILREQEIYLRMNDVPSAAAAAQRLIDRNPREVKGYLALAELYEGSKDKDKAAKMYESIGRQFPGNADAQFALAEYYRKTGDTARQYQYFNKVITNPALDAEAQNLLLTDYLREAWQDSTKRGSALKLTAAVVALHPDNIKLLTTYGDVLRLSGQRTEALVQYRRAVEQEPAQWALWERYLANMAVPELADSLIGGSNRAARFFPNQAGVYYMRGIGQTWKKDFPAAVKSLNRAADLQPEEEAEPLSDIYAALGDAYNSQKSYSASDSAYERALRLNPQNAGVLNNYAYYLSLRGQRLDEAERMSRKSLTLEPAQATYMDTYGWILYQQKQYEKAQRYIRQAIDAGTGNGDGTVWEHLGDVEYRLGRTDSAVEAWKKAKQLGADNPQLDRKIADRKVYE